MVTTLSRRWQILIIGTFATFQVHAATPTETDPHRPACTSPDCQKVKGFLKAHYCGQSPFGNGPKEGCEIRDTKHSNTDIDVGQPPPAVRKALIRELRRLGLPETVVGLTNFTFWKSRATHWSAAEASYNIATGSKLTLCQVIVMIDPNSKVTVVRQLRYQKTDADVPRITTWSLLDLIDVDQDSQPELVLRGQSYENQWLEVHSVQNGSHRIVFSGFGYYL